MMITKSIIPKRKAKKLWKLTYTVFLVIALLAMSLPLPTQAEVAGPGVIYVKSSAAASGNGESWATAYNDLQTALANAASGDQIWVAEGTYNLGADNRDTFTLKNGVAIYGGFAGTETLLNERNSDPASNNTTLSEGSWYTLHVVTAPAGTDASAILDGFTIANGYAYRSADSPADGNRGGGLLVYGSPTLANLIVRNNEASLGGGGMYIDGGSPALTNIVFTNNVANLGGGLAIHNGSPTMTGIKFHDNDVRFAYGGGGMHIVGGHTTLTNAIFSDNTIGSDIGRGGGLHLTSISVVAGEDYGVQYDTSLSLVNVVFAGNANAFGGGMHTSGGSATLVNVNFIGNNANKGGGLFVGTDEVKNAHTGEVLATSVSSVTVTNSIFWGNTGGDMPQIAVAPGSSLNISYSCVQGGCETVSNATCGPGNINAFPFINSGDPEVPHDIDWDGPDNIFNTWDDGLRLAVGSPAVDVGSDAAMSGVTTDIVGNPRIQDGDRNGTATVDMGVFESETARIGVIYVDKSATGVNNGSSWSDAFTEFQHALLVAEPDPTTEIWVAKGTYLPTVGTDRVGTFHLKNGVKLYGGFAGNETALGQRDPATYETILSGDLLGNDGSNFANRGDNSYHVVSAYGWATASAVLDGFTISGGNANGYGGALYLKGSPILANLSVEENTASSGGGMYIGGGNPALTDITFRGNHADFVGGGIFLLSGNPTLTNITLEGNDCTDPLGGGGGGNGGGMFVGDYNFITPYAGTLTLSNIIFKDNAAQFAGGLQVLSGNVSLSDVSFSGNHATGNGGGMIAGDHNFLQSYTGNLTMTGVSFLGNSAEYSTAGQYFGGGMLIYEASPTLTNVLFSGNYSRTHGGGIALLKASPTLTNVTFAGNAAATGGAIYGYESSPTITNSILWGDTGGEIVSEYGGSPNISYSIVQGQTNDETNHVYGDRDPLFVSPTSSVAPTTSGDLRLQAASPAIDAGNNYAAGLTGITTDLDGNPRFVDGNGDSIATVDIGAYEYQGAADTTAPVVTLDDVTTPTSDATPTFTGTAGILDGDSATVTVKVYSGSDTTGTLLQTLNATRNETTGAYSTTAADLADGTYTARAEQSDSAGNTGYSEARTFMVDTVSPTVTINLPDYINIANATAVPVTITSNEDGSYSYNISGISGSGSVTGGVPVDFNLDLSGLAEGAVTADASVEDTAGNTGYAPQDTAIKDTIAPTITLSSSASDPTSTSPIPVTATFSESVTGFALEDISVTNGTAANFSGSSSIYTFEVTPADQGEVTVSVPADKALDVAGNWNTASNILTRNYGEALLITEGGDPQNTAVAVGVQAEFTVKYTSSSVTSFQWQLSTNNGRKWSNIAGTDSDTYTTPVATSKMNGYQYRVILSNNFGEVTSKAAVLTVVTTDTVIIADVSISKTGIYDGGTNTVTWKVKLTNSGPHAAEGVVVTNTLSNNTRLLSVTTDYNYKVAGRKVTVDIGALNTGEFVEIIIIETLVTRSTGEVTNTATVTTTSYDPDLTNNDTGKITVFLTLL